MPELAGDIKIGLDLQTRSAVQNLSSLKKKISESFGSNDTNKLKSNIKETQSSIKKLESQIDKLQQKLTALSSGDAQPKSVIAMEKELTVAEQQLQKLNAEFEKLSQEQEELAHKPTTISTQEDIDRFKELDELIIKNGEDTEVLESRIAELKTKLDTVKGNPELSDEGRKYAQELDTATQELQKQKILLGRYTQQLSNIEAQHKNINKTTKETSKNINSSALALSGGVYKVLHRISRMASRIFIWQIFSKALRAIRAPIQTLLTHNDTFMKSLHRLQAALWTAFAPIYNYIVPALTTFMNYLSGAITLFARFIGMFTGKSLEQMIEGGKQLEQQANNYSDLDKNSKKAAKGMKGVTDEAKKQLAAFDDLTILTQGNTTESQDTPETSDFENLAAIGDKFNNIFETFASKLAPIIEELGKLKAALEPFKAFIWQGLLDFYNNCLVPIGNWIMGEGIPKFIAGLTQLFSGINWSSLNASLAEFWKVLSNFVINVIGEGILWFYQNVLVPMGIWAANNLVPTVLNLISSAIQLLGTVIIAVSPAFELIWNSFLAPLGEFMWSLVIGFLTQLTNAFKKLSDWASSNASVVQTIATTILAFLAGIWVYNTTKNLISFFGQLGASCVQLAKQFVLLATGQASAGVATAFVAGAVGILAAGIIVLASCWDKMTPAQRAVTILTALAAAATAAAIAIGVFHTAWTVGVAAAAIAAGLALLGLSFKFSDTGQPGEAAKSAADSFYSSYDWGTSLDLPQLATGAVLPPNKPFAAILGDQKHGKNLELPQSLLEETLDRKLDEKLSQNRGQQIITLNVDGREFGRTSIEESDRENRRIGTRLVTV